MRQDPAALRRIHGILLDAYGPQRWWPAESAFEVVVGAVLTQNTAWTNVEKAIAALKGAGKLDLGWLSGARVEEIAPLIRQAGCFNVKSRRLRAVCAWLEESGGLEEVGRLGRQELRRRLLSVHGVGPETADSIMLYALGVPSFVVDAYTRRLFARIGVLDRDDGYAQVKQGFERAWPPDSPGAERWYNEYHALIVEHSKRRCRKVPACGGCPLVGVCERGRQAVGPGRTTVGAVRRLRPGRRRPGRRLSPGSP